MAKNKISKKNKSMKSANGSGGRALLYTAGLVVAALAIIVSSSFLIPSFGPGMRGGMMGGNFGAPPEEVGRALDSFSDMRSVLAIFNIIIVIYLLYIHIKDYLRLRSSFTLGLVAFLASFLMYAISTLPEMHLLLGSYGRAAMISFVPMMFSAIGLLIFAKLSNE
ncbi:MAG: hypothetical protein NTX79_02105 [Candidatus Micrarchaeota archaeon]|nr:hypothetical protein [Candidatus Micrarchaeota archaeon]